MQALVWYPDMEVCAGSGNGLRAGRARVAQAHECAAAKATRSGHLWVVRCLCPLRGPVDRLQVLSLYWQAARGLRLAKWVGRASLRVSDNQAKFQMEKSLTPQAFASNNLNRSLADRRDAEFLQTSFQHAHFVVVSGSKVMVSKEPAVRLRWLEAPELENLGYSPSAEGTIQHAQQGKRHAT